MSPLDKFGKPRIIAGRWHNPGLIEQFLAKPIEKNEGRELRDRLLRALKAVRWPDDFYGDRRPCVIEQFLANDEAAVWLQHADIKRLIAILESGGNLNDAFGSTKPAHRETGSGNQGEVTAVIVRKLLEGKSVKQLGKELNRQPGDVRRIFWRYPQMVLKTLVKRLAGTRSS
jgi:hypothetical protein